MIKTLCSLLFLVLFASICEATTYQVTTAAEFSALSPVSGDVVQFEGGTIFRLTGGVVAVSGVTYESYGTGKAIIYQSYDGDSAGYWTEESTNIWKSANSSLPADFGIVSLSGDTVFGIKVYTKAELTSQGYCWYDSTNDCIYMYSTTNPASVYTSIEISTKSTTAQYLFYLEDKEDITISNLEIKYFAAHAIGGANCKNITITDCEIAYGGGWYLTGETKAGNGIQFWFGNSDTLQNILIERCEIYEIYDSPMTFQGSGTSSRCMNVIMRNNIIYNFGMQGFEYWNSQATNSVESFYFINNIVYGVGDVWAIRSTNQHTPNQYLGCIGLYNNHAVMNKVFFCNNILYSNATITEVSPSVIPRCLFVGGSYFDYLINVDIDNNAYWRSSEEMIFYQEVTYTKDQFTLYRNASGKDWQSCVSNDISLTTYIPYGKSSIASNGVVFDEVSDDYYGNERTIPYSIGISEVDDIAPIVGNIEVTGDYAIQ